MSFDYSQAHADERAAAKTEVRYDSHILIEQLTAVQHLDPGHRRDVGEVLVQYGRMMIDSGERLDELQRFLMSRRKAAA